MYNGMRLHEYNIMRYVTSLGYTIISREKVDLNRKKLILALDQNDFGQKNDCTLVSATALIKEVARIKYLSTEGLYSIIEEIAEKYCNYNGESKGTNPLVISTLLQRSLEKFMPNTQYKAKSKFLKGVPIIGFNFEKIKSYIKNMQYPMILNLLTDGRNYYKDHSVLIVGIETFKVKNNKTGKKKDLRFLRVYDNWNTSVSYINYELLGVSSINYFDI